MRKLLVTGAAVAVAGLAVIGLAGTAAAATGSTGWITHPTTSYTSPSKQSQPLAQLGQGTPVEALCYTKGEIVNGNPNWFRIAEDGESLGFVHRDAIGGVPGDLRHC